MARTKSAFRHALTTRHLAWTTTRALVRVAPALAKPLNFHPRPVAALDAADVILEDERWQEPLPFAGDLLRFVIQDCARYDKLAPDHRADAPVAHFHRQAAIVRDAEIHGHTGSIVLPAAGRTVNLRGQPVNWNFVKPAWLRTVAPVDRPAFFIWKTTHYYHFLVDNALRLVDAMARGRLAGGRATVVRYAGESAAQDAFFRAAAARWPDLDSRTLKAGQRIRAATLFWSAETGTNYEWPPFAPENAAVLASLYRDAYGLPPPAPPNRLIFLSRGGAKLRRLRNEDALTAAAAARGFEVFVARADNHPDQVRLFAEARAVVAVHGAGLANLLFAPAGTAVLELFPRNFTKSTFAWMAARLGMRYQTLVGSDGDYDQAFAVDPAAFAQALDALLAAGR